MRKLVFRVSELVRHKPDCTATGFKEEEGFYCLCSENKGGDQLYLVFAGFPMTGIK